MTKRSSGVLLHISSLMGPYGIGCFGRDAVRFIDFLREGGFRAWQVLPFSVPDAWNSPYKSVSAFANGIGGTLFFGIDDNRNVVGLADAQADAEAISRLIKERITPYPNFILTPEREKGRNILILSISAGHSTPYYYKADGVMEAYIRMGNESVMAPSYVLNQLLLKGMNHTFDALISEYNFKDYAFSKLRERYKAWTGNSMEEKLFDSFEIRNEYGKLTNAGALLADDAPIKQSRLFCTRWNGLDKSGGMVDALDGAEYSGSLIILLNEGVSFVKRNMKTRWKKTANSRIEMPDYCERSVFEALVNALIHRLWKAFHNLCYAKLIVMQRKFLFYRKQGLFSFFNLA